MTFVISSAEAAEFSVVAVSSSDEAATCWAVVLILEIRVVRLDCKLSTALICPLSHLKL